MVPGTCAKLRRSLPASLSRVHAVSIAQAEYHNYINGSFVPAADGTTLPVYNPATNAVVGLIPRSKSDDVNAGLLHCHPHRLPGLASVCPSFQLVADGSSEGV